MLYMKILSLILTLKKELQKYVTKPGRDKLLIPLKYKI